MLKHNLLFFFLLGGLDAGRVMQESVALDTSHESSRGTTRLPSPEPSADNEEFSDWDSWEDENEVCLSGSGYSALSSFMRYKPHFFFQVK